MTPAKEMAVEIGFDTVEFVMRWNGYSVYRGILSDPTVQLDLGRLFYFLESNCECRKSPPEETAVIAEMDDYGEEDEDAD